jgi:hypothetical protein
MGTLWSIAAVLALLLLAVVALIGIWVVRRPRRPEPLPTEWSLSARPVFSTDERRVYKLLREALPHHIVLSKLPLVRFSQPTDPDEVRYWYDLLGAINVTFAVCSANGRVLAAIDLDTDRGNSRRILQIKQSVLGACRIRYLRCPVDNLPTAAELQLLVPSSTAATARGPQPGLVPPRDLDDARDSLASTVATRRAQRSALWQDSSGFQDSFFAPDSRSDTLGNSEFASLTFANRRASATRNLNGHAAAPASPAGDAAACAEPGGDDDSPPVVVGDTLAAVAGHLAHAPLKAPGERRSLAMSAGLPPRVRARTYGPPPGGVLGASTRSACADGRLIQAQSYENRVPGVLRRRPGRRRGFHRRRAGATRRSSRSTPSPPSSRAARSRSPRRSLCGRFAVAARGAGSAGATLASASRTGARYRFRSPSARRPAPELEDPAALARPLHRPPARLNDAPFGIGSRPASRRASRDFLVAERLVSDDRRALGRSPRRRSRHAATPSTPPRRAGSACTATAIQATCYGPTPVRTSSISTTP